MLEMKNISKLFSGVTALFNVSLSLKSGEVHGIVGENGAGKSTLMKILNGVYQASQGSIFVDGKEIHPDGVKDAQKYGISIIFQEFSLIPDLNAYENIFLGKEIINKFRILNSKEMLKRAKETFDKMNVIVPLGIPVENLSIAEQQFIEIAKALSFNCKYLVLDEPTATLTPKEASKLFIVLKELKQQGLGCFFISHHLEEIFEISDRVSCLRDGQHIGTYDPKAITEDDLITKMVGRKLEYAFPPKRGYDFESREVILDIKSVINTNNKKASFCLYEGEILGMAGLVGSGRTELCRSIIGAYPIKSKDILLRGKNVNLSHPAEALKHGIGYLSEDRKKYGCFSDFTIQDNVTISALHKILSKIGFISKKAESSATHNYIKRLQIKTPSTSKYIGQLSGGNQQKVIIARWLFTDSKVLIFDEPTRGIDVGAKVEIYDMLQILANEGMSIIVISSDLPEVMGISDRILVMQENEIKATLTGNDINSETIMKYASGV